VVSKTVSILLTTLGLIGLVLGAGGSPQAAEGAASFSYRELGITHGAHIRPTYFEGPPVWGYGDEILAFDDLAGKDIGVVMYFSDWRRLNDRAFDPFLQILINNEITDPSRRPIIMLTWEPTRPELDNFGCTKSYSGPIPPADITAGNCDAYINMFREDIMARPERFLLRFAHEMNITDSPWWPGNWSSTDADMYVQMYRHVYNVIMADPAPTNLEWVWSPNWASNPPDAWNAIPNYYPGDAYVDWIGLSGYNWYNAPGHSEPWHDFNYLYDDVLTDLTCRYAKPQIIAEVGSVEGNGTTLSKAAWIGDLYARAPNYPFLRSIVWFNDYAQANPSFADFRVTTSSAQLISPDSVNPLPSSTHAWTDAYSAAIAAPVYNSTLPSLAAATPPHPVCAELYLPLITR